MFVCMYWVVLQCTYVYVLQLYNVRMFSIIMQFAAVYTVYSTGTVNMHSIVYYCNGSRLCIMYLIHSYILCNRVQ